MKATVIKTVKGYAEQAKLIESLYVGYRVHKEYPKDSVTGAIFGMYSYSPEITTYWSDKLKAPIYWAEVKHRTFTFLKIEE